MANKYMTGLRHIADYNAEHGIPVNSFDLLLLNIIKDGPKKVTCGIEAQYNFCYDPKRMTRKKIAAALRSIAYKIQHSKD